MKSVPASTVTRIRKLLRLASSPEPHEAARAAEQARALMEKYGVTADDVAEHVLEQVDTCRDAYREFLAHLAASLCQCSVMFSKQGGIGFRGMPARVKKARLFYQSAMDEVRGANLPPIAPWFQSAAKEVWRFYWWDGFAAAVYERFGRRPPVEREAPNRFSNLQYDDDDSSAAYEEVPEVAPANVEEVLTTVRQSVEAMCFHVDQNWLRREALSAGRGAGYRIQLREDEARTESAKGLQAKG